MAVTLTESELAGALGVNQALADRLLPVAKELVETIRTRLHLNAVANEAAIRCAGWLADQTASASLQSERFGDVEISMGNRAAMSALRHSGAMALLSHLGRCAGVGRYDPVGHCQGPASQRNGSPGVASRIQVVSGLLGKRKLPEVWPARQAQQPSRQLQWFALSGFSLLLRYQGHLGRSRAVSPGFLGQVGRDLIRRGESLHVIQVDACWPVSLLIPSASWHLGGRQRASRYAGRVRAHGFTAQALPVHVTIILASSGCVIFLPWGATPGQPYTGSRAVEPGRQPRRACKPRLSAPLPMRWVTRQWPT